MSVDGAVLGVGPRCLCVYVVVVCRAESGAPLVRKCHCGGYFVSADRLTVVDSSFPSWVVRRSVLCLLDRGRHAL